MKKLLFLLSLIILPIKVIANDITNTSSILINSEKQNKIIDKNENTYITIKNTDKITITNKEDIYGLYIIYELTSQSGRITIDNKNIAIGENNFLHEYIDLKNTPSNEITITYNEDVKIGEIYILSDGELPEYIEIWEPPLDNNTDLLLLSTHSDDEQLFFLGLLPTYVAKGANVQVVYLTNHYDNPKRLHEQLHGLYTVGIRNYPIIGIVPDAYSESLNGAINNINKANLSVDDVTNFQVEMIRKFKPSVIVGHDELGEYSHGQHILNTHTLKIALEKSNDATYHIESYEKYGLWDTPKTYLHLYKDNQIIMDYDTPLEYFNGLTAYEVSKLGYSKHNSQQWTWFTKWINGSKNEYTKSTDIKKYSPNEFGLYKSLVGEDYLKNDMFENLTYRKDEIKEENNNSDNIIEEIKNTTNKDTINYFKEFKYFIIPSIIILIIFLYLIFKRKIK